MQQFERPSKMVNEQNKFGPREVGITHPDNQAYFKIADNGDMYLMCRDGLGAIFSVAQNTLFFVADNVKFLTKEDEGLRWNNLAFNSKAVTYSEPAFIYPKKQNSGIYEGVLDFLD